MSRQQFYSVPEDAYLFRTKTVTTDPRAKLEEPVRQWCAFELLRAYGINIADLEFERQVRIGSKRHRIDILVSRGRSPFVVVECKEPNHGKHEEGMQQALSYASSPEIRAEFAVYTNGTIWHVQRRVGDHWTAVPDIPSRKNGSFGEPLTEIFRGLDAIAPILCKLDEQLSGEDAKTFLSALQQFFHGTTFLTATVDDNLQFATDNLLRVLWAPDHHPEYRLGKLETARRYFEAYRLRAQIGYEIFPVTGKEDLRMEIKNLHNGLYIMLDGAHGLAGMNFELLRLNVLLTEYGFASNDRFPALPSSIHQSLRSFLNEALTLSMNTQLPQLEDRILNGDLRSYCWSSWEQMQREEVGDLKPAVNGRIPSLSNFLKLFAAKIGFK